MDSSFNIGVLPTLRFRTKFAFGLRITDSRIRTALKPRTHVIVTTKPWITEYEVRYRHLHKQDIISQTNNPCWGSTKPVIIRRYLRELKIQDDISIKREVFDGGCFCRYTQWLRSANRSMSIVPLPRIQYQKAHDLRCFSFQCRPFVLLCFSLGLSPFSASAIISVLRERKNDNGRDDLQN